MVAPLRVRHLVVVATVPRRDPSWRPHPRTKKIGIAVLSNMASQPHQTYYRLAIILLLIITKM